MPDIEQLYSRHSEFGASYWLLRICREAGKSPET
jgi:hypothetical protein